MIGHLSPSVSFTSPQPTLSAIEAPPLNGMPPCTLTPDSVVVDNASDFERVDFCEFGALIDIVMAPSIERIIFRSPACSAVRRQLSK